MLDIETDSDTLLALGWSWFGEFFVYRGDEVPLEIKLALANPKVSITTHTKYDARWLRLHGWTVNGPFIDTQVMAWLLDENQPLDLDNLHHRYTGVKLDKRLIRRANRVWFRCDDGSVVPIGEAPWDQLTRYNLGDVEGTKRLYDVLLRRLQDSPLYDYWLNEEVPFTSVLLDMECAGLPVDVDATRELAHEVETSASSLEERLKEEAGLPPSFNIGSGDQLAAYLFLKQFNLPGRLPREPEYEYGLAARVQDFVIEKARRKWLHGYWRVEGRGLKPTPPTDNGKRPSTKTPVLMVLHGRDEWVRDLIRWRKMDKLLSTYLYMFPAVAVDGRLYGRFNQTGTKTGRLSSSDPNLQNIPAHGEMGPKVRALFCGDLVVGDYSQLELRLMAHFSEDPVMLDVYRDERDIHLLTAQRVFGKNDVSDEERFVSKTLNFAMGYGAAGRKLQEILAKGDVHVSVDEAEAYLAELRGLYPVFFEWRDRVIESVHQTHYVKTLSGRHRRLGGQFKDRNNWKTIGYGERQAVNAIIQGSAGDVVRRLMVQSAQEWVADYVTLLAQVHDELVWEYEMPSVATDLDCRREVLLSLRKTAENPGFDLRVPLVFEPKFVKSWAEK